jgi:uncharacterized membrane protein YccC
MMIRQFALRNPWFRFAIATGLVVLAAFSFLHYIGWAFAHSATMGLASRMQETRLANGLAWIFLGAFVALEVLSAFIVGFSWEYPDLGSPWLRFLARYGLALVLTLLATGIVVGFWLATGRFT